MVVSPDHVGKHCGCLPDRRICKYDCARYQPRGETRSSVAPVSPVLFDFSKRAETTSNNIWETISPYKKLGEDDRARREEMEKGRGGEEEEEEEEERGVDTVDA